jgi:two-component system, NarL family, response regulator LiaR
MIRVVIIDDHQVVLEGLRLFLQQAPELDVVGEAVDGSEAIEKVQSLHPDVVLMDLLLPKLDGLAATAIIHQKMPETKVLVLTNGLGGGTSVMNALRAGASGYLLKDTPASELYKAIKVVAQGQTYLPSQISRSLVEEIQTPVSEPLTEREKDVLRLLVQGHSNKEIARHLHIAEETVKTHIKRIYGKLGVQSRAQAILTTMRLSLV